jgi:hypothetical protein
VGEGQVTRSHFRADADREDSEVLLFTHSFQLS